MANIDRYRKERDLIFQEIEEMDRLEQQAIAATKEADVAAETQERLNFILRLCKSKLFRHIFVTTPLEQRTELINDLFRLREERQASPASGTQI